MIAGYRIHGHAIVSADGRIAEADGTMPPSLHNDADWQRFQAALDEAVLTVLGRHGHEAHPNPRGRNRMVVSSTAKGLERRRDAWWWNPADIDVGEAITEAAPDLGIVAVPGGQRVFDLFLAVGFDAFFLARARKVKIPTGIPVFSALEEGRKAGAVLLDHGLVPKSVTTLDEKAGVNLVEWRVMSRA